MDPYYEELVSRITWKAAQKLGELRLERRISQRQVADTAGVDSSLVSQLERGLRDAKLSTWIRVARGLGYEFKIGFENVLCDEGEALMIEEKDRRDINREQGLRAGKRRYW